VQGFLFGEAQEAQVFCMRKGRSCSGRRFLFGEAQEAQVFAGRWLRQAGQASYACSS